MQNAEVCDNAVNFARIKADEISINFALCTCSRNCWGLQGILLSQSNWRLFLMGQKLYFLGKTFI